LQEAQEKMSHFHNKDWQDNYHVGVVISEKKHRERNMLNSSYKELVVKENLLRKAIINNRSFTFHNDNIK